MKCRECGLEDNHKLDCGRGQSFTAIQKKLQEEIPEPLYSLHKQAAHHRIAIESSQMCACFYCGETFPPTEIKKWTDENKTAICPECGIDSVLPVGAVPAEYLEKLLDDMYNAWFGEGV